MRDFTAQLPDTVGVFGTKAFHCLMPGPMRRFDCFEPGQGRTENPGTLLRVTLSSVAL